MSIAPTSRGALLAALAAAGAIAAACGGGGELDLGARRSAGTDGGAGGPGTVGGGGGGYDPSAPSNTGEPKDPARFAGVLPILQAHCSECHHAGSPLDLTTGLDAKTAGEVVTALEAGTMPPAPRARLSAEDVASLRAFRDGAAFEPASAPPAPAAPTVAPLLAAGTLATYKAALPKVAWPRLAAVLASPTTLFYDKDTIPGAYQDTVGDGSSLPFGARLNDSGKGLIVPEGKKLFSEDGSTWAFPFGHTAGTDASPDVFVVNFLALPVEAGKVLPVVYRVESGSASSFPVTRWNWSFPKGTLVGEVVMVRDGGALRTTEIRTRERFADSWATNVFRPFPSAATLAAAIKARRPAWQATPALAGAVAALEDTAGLRAQKVGSPAFGEMVKLEGYVDTPLPVLEPALVRELLAETPFVSAYGVAWKASGAQKAFGPTGPAVGPSVVPARFESGLLEVRESTCTKCHDQGGTFIGDLVDQAILYGDVWGVDRVFSFHPFDPARIDASGQENRSVRAQLAGLVVRYDAASHPATTYTFYRPK